MLTDQTFMDRFQETLAKIEKEKSHIYSNEDQLKAMPAQPVNKMALLATEVVATLVNTGLTISDIANVIKEMRNVIAETLIGEINDHKNRIECSEKDLQIIREA